MVSVEAGYAHTVGLRAYGTVATRGYNESGRCNVGSWKNVVAVDAGETCSIGLTADGSLLVAGRFSGGKTGLGFALPGEDSLAAAAAGSHFMLGLLRDGTVLSAGPRAAQLTSGVSEWTGVRQPENSGSN